MYKPTLIKSRVSTGTLWVEESDLLPTDEVVVRFPELEPKTELEKTAIIFAIAARRKRKHRVPGQRTKLVGPSMTSPEVVQHLRMMGKIK